MRGKGSKLPDGGSHCLPWNPQYSFANALPLLNGEEGEERVGNGKGEPAH